MASAEADITHIGMGHECASTTREQKLVVPVRGRLHLAEVIRTPERTTPVLRVARAKP
jgi:GTP diphosphokinase / guanosine-3',5'-bis(diphosphate) 3'-diphosphatase